jgi:hypothetical protein
VRAGRRIATSQVWRLEGNGAAGNAGSSGEERGAEAGKAQGEWRGRSMLVHAVGASVDTQQAWRPDVRTLTLLYFF